MKNPSPVLPPLPDTVEKKQEVQNRPVRSQVSGPGLRDPLTCKLTWDLTWPAFSGLRSRLLWKWLYSLRDFRLGFCSFSLKTVTVGSIWILQNLQNGFTEWRRCCKLPPKRHSSLIISSPKYWNLTKIYQRISVLKSYPQMYIFFKSNIWKWPKETRVCMYVVCNHTPGPSVLGAPDPRRTSVFVSNVNILIPSPHTPLTVCRTVP